MKSRSFIPQIEIEGHANLNFDEKENTTFIGTSMDFYGNILLDPPPTDFKSAVKVYEKSSL